MTHENFFTSAKASLAADPTRENLARWLDAAAEVFYGDHARMHSVLRMIFRVADHNKLEMIKHNKLYPESLNIRFFC